MSTAKTNAAFSSRVVTNGLLMLGRRVGCSRVTLAWSLASLKWTWPCENTAPPLPCPCSLIRTYCATLAASHWLTRARIRGSFRITSDTGTFSHQNHSVDA